VLLDRYRRPFLKMRLVINDECNYSCIFCHFEGQRRDAGELLGPSDYGFFAATLAKLGVRDYKITGGEPLLRRDVFEIIRELRRSGSEISLTTNGFLLYNSAYRLRASGLSRVNVSLHVYDPEKYSEITGVDREWFYRVVDGILEAKRSGLGIKINAVVLRGINTSEDDVRALIKFASSSDASLQFIELMPVGEGASAFGQYYEPVETGLKIVQRLGGRPIKLREELHNRPVFILAGVRIEFVKNWGNPYFCAGCTTMRLTSDGKLKPCLYKPPVVDLLPYIKSRDSDKLIDKVKEVVASREPNFKDGQIRLSVRF